jgi:uncharacterized membrane protein YeaQ/YmgE (transglycosylase-associated protein family)
VVIYALEPKIWFSLINSEETDAQRKLERKWPAELDYEALKAMRGEDLDNLIDTAVTQYPTARYSNSGRALHAFTDTGTALRMYSGTLFFGSRSFLDKELRGEPMSILAWIVLGLIAGFIGSKIVNKSGEGILMDIVLGIVGALLGGWLFNRFGQAGVTGLNLYSLLVAVVGAVVLLVLYHMVRRAA